VHWRQQVAAGPQPNSQADSSGGKDAGTNRAQMLADSRT
jgi:hypothetical protein